MPHTQRRGKTCIIFFSCQGMGRHYIIPVYSLKGESAARLEYTPTRTCSLISILISLIKAKDKDSDFPLTLIEKWWCSVTEATGLVQLQKGSSQCRREDISVVSKHFRKQYAKEKFVLCGCQGLKLVRIDGNSKLRKNVLVILDVIH